MTLDRAASRAGQFAILAMAIMGPFVEGVSPLVVLFLCGFSVFVFLTLPGIFERAIVRGDFVVAGYAFFLLLQTQYSLLMGHSVVDILRSIVPFLFLVVAYFAAASLSNTGKKQLVTAIFIFGIFVAAHGLIAVAMGAAAGALPRLTAVSDNSHLPILLIATALLPAMKLRRGPMMGFGALLIAAILATQSNGQVLALGALIAIWILSRPATGVMNVSRTRRIIYALLPGLALLLVANLLGIQIFARFDELASAGSTILHRIEEILYGWQVFVSHPFLGGGPGTIFLVNSPVSGELEAQRYVHNVAIYMLATGGLTGTVAYGAVVACGLFGSRQSDAGLNVAVRNAILVSLAYCLVSATFKSIQFNVMLGLLIASVATRQPHSISRVDARALES